MLLIRFVRLFGGGRVTVGIDNRAEISCIRLFLFGLSLLRFI